MLIDIQYQVNNKSKIKKSKSQEETKNNKLISRISLFNFKQILIALFFGITSL